MAHQLKYYKEIKSHGHLWRVEFLQETEETLTPMEIGPVLQGLRLVMQGDQADVDTPIVKTSMEMTFVDAPDHEEGRKCGYWEEFYTSSATEYVVLLLKDGEHEWVGYITPDSFSEDLRYRGSVTIIARDGLGALQDYDFDAAGDSMGLITLGDIINKAWSVLPILSNWDAFPTKAQFYLPYSTDGDAYIFAAKFNVSALRGKTWWEVLEDALYATGMVLRFEGNKTFRVRSLRQLGLATSGYWFDSPILDVQFRAYGHRELSPAVKNIKEEVQFEIQDNIANIDMPSDAYGSVGYIEHHTEDYAIVSAPVYAYKGYEWGGNVEADASILLNPFAYAQKQGKEYRQWGLAHDENVLYLASNLTQKEYTERTHILSWSSLVNSSNSMRISFRFSQPVVLYDGMTTIGDYIDGGDSIYGADILMSVEWTGNSGKKLYLNRSEHSQAEKQWVSGENSDMLFYYLTKANLKNEESFDLPLLQTDEAGRLTIRIGGVEIYEYYPNSTGNAGMYLRLTELNISDDNSDPRLIASKLRLNTIYDGKNNIALTRSPQFAPNPSNALAPQQIKNNIYIGDEPFGSERWVFKQDDIPQPLAVLIHQQMLAFYSKPNNVLTGELRDKGGAFPDFTSLWRWNGVDHLLTSGTLNILTGAMESATLREFKRYDRMWETWVEQESYEIDYYSDRVIILRVHTNKALTKSDVRNVPMWLTLGTVVESEPGMYYVTFSAMGNDVSYPRTALVKIDGAYVRIVQRAAGDYGTDYGKDYS